MKDTGTEATAIPEAIAAPFKATVREVKLNTVGTRYKLAEYLWTIFGYSKANGVKSDKVKEKSLL